MKRGISIRISSVNYAPHLLLNKKIIIAEKRVNCLDVDKTAIITVHHNFVVITRFENHMQNRLLEFVLH